MLPDPLSKMLHSCACCYLGPQPGQGLRALVLSPGCLGFLTTRAIGCRGSLFLDLASGKEYSILSNTFWQLEPRLQERRPPPPCQWKECGKSSQSCFKAITACDPKACPDVIFFMSLLYICKGKTVTWIHCCCLHLWI